jgi:7-cyano-7-deazaguanine tRNA-ribosyltransferase
MVKVLIFEIKHKDARGRLGILKTSHGKVKTPSLMPVVHPEKQILPVRDYGADLVITNAYLIYKNNYLREKALEEGVHNLIDFSGPVITDSGSFQLSLYGDVQVSNQKIVEFQEKIGTDIGTSLDIPTPPFVKRERAEKELEITIQRAKESLEVRDKMQLNSVVQGSTYPDLRSRCADILGRLNFQVHPIGAMVPLLESYRYQEVVRIIMSSVTHLPDSRPRHLMGAGHPMIFGLAVAMGCDLFDSAAYILYAEDDRLMMPNGTYKLDNLQEMPCYCEVCSNYTPNELRGLVKKERTSLLAQHNLTVSFGEIRTIRQAIIDGNLWELVEQRCRSHPYLLDALRILENYQEDLERYDPPYKKSAFFYSGPESLNRPEVFRHLKRLQEIPKKRKVILLPPSNIKPYSQNIAEIFGKFYCKKKGNFRTTNTKDWEEKKYNNLKFPRTKDLQLVVVDVPFSIIPLELDQVYPLAQNESPRIFDEDIKKRVRNVVQDYILGFEEVIVSKNLLKRFNIKLSDLNLEYEYQIDKPIILEILDLNRIFYIADYQFGTGAGKALFNGPIKLVKSRKTGKIRHVYVDENECEINRLIATLRASDGVFVLASEGARRLHQYFPYPQKRVVVNQVAEPFARKGKSIFAKFVINCDINIRANEEVLIVNENDQLLAFGKSLLNGREISDLNSGQAVKTRKGGF